MEILVQIIFFITLSYFIIQAILALAYKKVRKTSKYSLPYCSVIVPAYNEENNIIKTIESVVDSDYPKDSFEIILVNDGSKDGTSKKIKEYIEQTSINNIIFVDLKENKGKRNAILQGIKNANGEIIVTIDSDTIILNNSLRKLIYPFVRDKNVGGVAGNILINNLDDGIIPKMLSSAFMFGFEFLRKAQSKIGCVLCTPGAFSAYRKVALEKDIFNWSEQTFLGEKANIGEDRALTTIILNNNYKVLFQSNAISYTNVPTTYKSLSKMFIRWIRGDIRENILMIPFIFKMFFRKTNFNKIGLFFNYFMMSLWLILPIISIFYIYIGCTYSFYFVFVYLFWTIVWSTLPACVYYKFSKKDYKRTIFYVYLFGIINFLTIMWIIPYSWITLKNSKWLTR